MVMSLPTVSYTPLFAIFLATLRFLFFPFLQPATPDICFTTYRPSRDHHYHRRCHSVVPSTSLSWSRRNTRTVCVGGDERTDGGSIIVWRDILLSRSLPNSLSISLSCSFSSQIRSRAHFNLTLQFTLVAIVSTMPTTRPFRGRRNGVEKCLPCFASISLAYRRKCWTRVWHGNCFVVCGCCCCWCCCWKKTQNPTLTPYRERFRLDGFGRRGQHLPRALGHDAGAELNFAERLAVLLAAALARCAHSQRTGRDGRGHGGRGRGSRR